MADLVLARRGRRLTARGALFLLLGAVCLCPLTPGVGQVAPASQSTPGARPLPGTDPMAPPDPSVWPNPHKLEQMREDERRKRLMSDTEKLVELTNELKSEVDKATKDELSLDVVRKAAEIEKLAHDVKERMKS